MVNNRSNGVHPVFPINAPTKGSTTRGRDRGRGREISRGRGGGRVSHIRDGAPVYNAHVNESPLAHHEEVEENVYFGDVENTEEVGQMAEVQDTNGVPLIDLVLA